MHRLLNLKSLNETKRNYSLKSKYKYQNLEIIL